jgi:hypothetical protein
MKLGEWSSNRSGDRDALTEAQVIVFHIITQHKRTCVEAPWDQVDALQARLITGRNPSRPLLRHRQPDFWSRDIDLGRYE